VRWFRAGRESRRRALNTNAFFDVAPPAPPQRANIGRAGDPSFGSAPAYGSVGLA
jgi:hypothetical protein